MTWTKKSNQNPRAERPAPLQIPYLHQSTDTQQKWTHINPLWTTIRTKTMPHSPKSSGSSLGLTKKPNPHQMSLSVQPASYQLICFSRKAKQHGYAMSMNMFYLVQLSNQYYIEHSQRSLHPATERRQILPYLHPRASPCEHNLPTPCPPSTPILVQWTNSGRNLDVHVVKGPDDTLIQTLHTDLFNKMI